MSVMDDVQELADREPVDEGYIIAFNRSKAPHIDTYYRTSFVQQKRDRPGEVTGGNLRDATLYPTYQAAAIAASGWVHTRKPDTRIIHIKRVCPYEVMEDYPTNIVDAVAEAS